MRIDRYSFGAISIHGKTYTSDLKIINNRIVPDWRRITGHQVSIRDVEDILAENPEIVVLGKGDPGNMEADDELLEQFRKKGIEPIQLPTDKATEKFNQLAEEDRRLAAGFHLTC